MPSTPPSRPMPARHLEKVKAHALQTLVPAHQEGAEPAELIRRYRSFLKKEEHFRRRLVR